MTERTPAHVTLDETVLIPAGTFTFGEAGDLRYLEPFRIDRYPVTVARYAEFLDATGHPAPLDFAKCAVDPALRDHPVTRVSYFDAVAFCDWLGRALPSEEQWEKAARGTDGRAYPWGDRFDVRRLNSRAAKKRGTTPVTAFPEGASPFGVLDLVGNVWEWTDSWYDDACDLKVLKGGCYALTKEHAAISHRHFNDPAFGNNLTGFRTVEIL